MNEQERILWSLERHGRGYNDWLLERASPLGPRVLEVGAGIGTFTIPLGERGLTITAIESKANVAAALFQVPAGFHKADPLRDDTQKTPVHVLSMEPAQQ